MSVCLQIKSLTTYFFFAKFSIFLDEMIHFLCLSAQNTTNKTL